MRTSLRSTNAGAAISKSSPVTTSRAWLVDASFWCPSTWLPSSVTLQNRVRFLLLNGSSSE